MLKIPQLKTIDYKIHSFLLSDIDECLNSTICDTNAVCNNTPGSLICLCNPGYSGDGATCEGT